MVMAQWLSVCSSQLWWHMQVEFAEGSRGEKKNVYCSFAEFKLGSQHTQLPVISVPG